MPLPDRQPQACGTVVAASSDAPYSGPDPWAAMRSAVDRRTRLGSSVGPAEAVDPATALSLYLGGFARPGGRRRRVAAGAAADLCLLAVPLDDALQALDAGLVAATLVAGAGGVRSPCRPRNPRRLRPGQRR